MKKNNILVGPGRGSGAASLVNYSLGIINIDPMKYDLIFERFLNPDRITMPDIDIDFDFICINEGDALLLCTDGLSGLVGKDELLKIIFNCI